MKIFSLRPVFLFILLSFFSCWLPAQVVINEFMAANSSIVEDPDNGETADWVELYNAGPDTIDLSGYFLTDNLTNEDKWTFPEGTLIPANGYLIIWADGTDTLLHTSYNLSRDGEEIGLFDPELNLIDSLIYDAQSSDISYGRYPDGSDTWAWFLSPTPEASNNTSTPYTGITYFEPAFSVRGGIFSASQVVELSSLGGVIRYTLDGRTPTVTDSVYSEPFTLDTSTFLRARVFVDGAIPGPTITHSYFFDETLAGRGLPVVSLVTDPDYFWDPDIGIYVQNYKPEWEYPVNIEFFENDGANRAAFNERAGVKVNGLWSWQLPQKMLGIYFRRQYGAGKLDYPLFHDRDRSSFDDIILRASGSDWAFTLIRDGLAQSLVQEYAPVPYQGFRQSIMFLNGQYMGIHNLRSRSNDGFIEENYGMAPGTYDLIENDGDVDEGSVDQYLVMDALFNSDLTDQNNFDSLSAIVDMQNFTDYWITEIWSSNRSWGHNVKLWKPKDGGKWQFIFGDLDRGFSGSTNDGIDEFSVPVGSESYNYARRWLQHILQNEGYAEYFAQRFTDHVYTTFHPQRVSRKIDEFIAPIMPEIAYHVDRWTGTTSNYGDGISTVEFWEDQILGLRQFANERQTFILSDIRSTFGLDDLATLGLAGMPAAGGRIRINEFKVPELPWSGPYFEEMPLALTAEAEPGYEFTGWSSNEYSEVIPLQSSWKYYDNGDDLGTVWRESAFEDGGWQSGSGELGYGDGDETTVVSYGSNSGNKYTTTYFRHTFEYDGPEEVTSALISLRRDDGAVVYLNGQEVIRSNMPEGDITFDTFASGAVSGSNESDLLQFAVEALFLNGENVLAVEIHQANSTSSDISFDLNMSVLIPDLEIISTDPELPVTLSGNASYTAHFLPTAACILPAEIQNDMTLTADCSPYLTGGDVVVLPNVSLTVEPGVEIWFPEKARLLIQGDLQVNGNDTLGVLFRENAEMGAASWGNVTFENATDTSHLNYLEVRHATKGKHPVHHAAAITGWYSDIVLDHMTLTDNFSDPIYGEYANITLTNSLIHSDVTGDLINVKYGDGWISDCQFIGNEAPDTDAIDYDEVIDGVIRNSSIEGFYGFNSDGIDLGEQSRNILIENCFINNCTDKGISIGQNSDAIIRSNTIVNCNLGIGLKDQGVAEVDHITFYSNVKAVAAFQKNPGFGGGIVSVTNSIISNSIETPLFADELSSASSDYNVYDSGILEGPNTYWADPFFWNPVNYDFHLQPNSMAVLAGSDGQDLGTLDFTFSAPPRIMISDIQYDHPDNPDIESLKVLNPGVVAVDMGGYSISDGIEFIFPEGTAIAPGEKITLVRDISLFQDLTGQVFEWTSGRLSNEGELLLLKEHHGIIIDHVNYGIFAPWPHIELPGDHISLFSPSLDNHFGKNWQLVQPTVDVEETPQPTVMVFPNPASDRLLLISEEVIGQFTIFDSVGARVLEGESGINSLEIDVSDLVPGIYLILTQGKSAGRFAKI